MIWKRIKGKQVYECECDCCHAQATWWHVKAGVENWIGVPYCDSHSEGMGNDKIAVSVSAQGCDFCDNELG